MLLVYAILGLFLAYLIGSFPTAVWYGKAHFGIDIREHGSGNAGATNTFRVLGKKAGVIVMFIDILKGFTATKLPLLLLYSNMFANNTEYVVCQLLFGFIAVLGHVFPVFAGFRGGKGVATLLGMVLAINPLAAGVCVLIFTVVLLLSKYVSLGSMIASLAFPILLFFPRFYQYSPNPLHIAFGFVVFMMVVLTHQKNIRRLINGEENKANIRLRRKIER